MGFPVRCLLRLMGPMSERKDISWKSDGAEKQWLDGFESLLHYFRSLCSRVILGSNVAAQAD